MNELIQELLQQSTDNVLGVPVVNQKKFAELIVRECANRASWAQDTNEADIGGEVLKHFGVEE